MKIMAHIPVRRVDVSPCSYTFDVELLEVDVVRIVRYPATRYPHLNRWYYQADIADHSRLHPDACRTGYGGTYRVNVVRSINPSWRPPEWPAGANCIEFPGATS